MSWTAPVTRATGYIVLATDWNAVQNDLLELDRIYAKKTTSKTVASSTTATDLLDGEITIGAGDMGIDGILRLTAWGKWKQNVATNKNTPSFQLKLGGTMLIETGNFSSAVAQQFNQYFPWKFTCDIQNLGAANSQQAYLHGALGMLGFFAGNFPGNFTTGVGMPMYLDPTGPGSTTFAIYDGGNDGLAVDTTAACALELKVVNAINNAAYITELLGAVVELIQ